MDGATGLGRTEIGRAASTSASTATGNATAAGGSRGRVYKGA